MNSEMVSISVERYVELVAAEDWVAALEAAGVDNWSGYDEAREIYQGMTTVEDVD